MDRNITEKENELNPRQLEKAFEVLDYMNNVDIREVRSKTEKLIMGHRSKKQRIRLLRYSAAVIFLLLVSAGIRLFVDKTVDVPSAITRISNDVILMMPDGIEITLNEDTGDNLIARDDEVSVKLANGSLVFQKEVNTSSVETKYSNLIVPRGARFDMELEDGTHVWLNSDSRLRFPSVFPDSERRVFLEGEAYFAVSHDGYRPFIVETSEQSLKVTGTEFNVYAYPEEGHTLTTLISGSISVRSYNNTAETILKPGQLARLRAGTDNYTVENVDTEEFTAWRDGIFVFNGISLEQVFIKLSRCYDFEYHFEDSRARNLVLRGSVPIYDDLDFVLEIIESSGLTTIEQSGRQIRVKTKE